MPRSEQEITVGKIVGPFGTGGEVKVLALTDFPERFDEGKPLRIREADGKIRVALIRKSREYKAGFIVKLDGVDGRNDAESLRDAEIVIGADELGGLAEGSFYIFDLIGLRVTSEDGRECGEVTDCFRPAGTSVYVTSTGLHSGVERFVVAKWT